MATEDPTHRRAKDPAPKDPRTERVILALLLHEHPSRLTVDGLIVVLRGNPRHPDPADVAERAIRELVAAGLLERKGQSLAPTRAALHFDRLEMD